MRARLAWSLSRRIDRLASRAHAFHRFAHHPLCGRYEHEVLRVGRRVRLCRGCTFTLGAGALGLVAAPFVTLTRPQLYAMLVTALLLAGQSVLFPHTLRVRLGKLGTRALPAFCGGLCVAAGMLSMHWDVAITALLAIATLVTLYRKRGPDRTPCFTCPEYGGEKICSGFSEIVRAERAFARRSQRLIDLDLRKKASASTRAHASNENGVKFVSRS